MIAETANKRLRKLNRCCIIIIVFAFLTSSGCWISIATADQPENWPQWRGPSGTGVAPDADPPIEWSDTNNVRWKTPLPGRGHSTPIVYGDKIFVTAAVPIGAKLPAKSSGRPGAHDNLAVDSKYRFTVIAIDRRDGRVLWKKGVHEAIPLEGGHYTASLASASPVTDGNLVFAHFGSHGLYCLDVDGNLLWKKTIWANAYQAWAWRRKFPRFAG